jgi:hypothetical protein
MDPAVRVCPFCGKPPGQGVFCDSCGRNLAGVERLPTAAEYEAKSAPVAPPEPAADTAVAEFVAAMRDAGNPGVAEFPAGRPRAFRRIPRVTGWVVRPVDREDFEKPRRYVPGLLLSVDGRFHQLDSELRGFGQRDFPQYEHRVSPEPVDPPLDGRLAGELAQLRASLP